MSETPMMKLKMKKNNNRNMTDKGKIAEASSSSAPIPIPTGHQEAGTGNTFADDSLSSRSSSRRQSSKPRPPRRYECPICSDKLRQNEFFRGGCEHLYCKDCVSKYVAAKVRENIVYVKCPDPGCGSLLDPQTCREIVPKDVLERWEQALGETLILEANKFYCPFKDCSAVMEDDGAQKVTSAECPSCRRLFCAQCRVAWHAGVECSEFQRRGKGQDEAERRGEKQMKKLAKTEKWRRCPGCKLYVEKIQGCSHMSCRCGFEFCYSCGSTWSIIHYCKSS